MPAPTLQAEDLVLCSGTVMTTPFLDRLEPARRSGFKGLSMNAGDIASTRATGISTAELIRRVADAGLAIAEFDAVTSWLPFHQRPDGRESSNPLKGADAEHICPIARGARRPICLCRRDVRPGGRDEPAAEGFAHVCDVATKP